jgi:hypothetical protein
VLASFTIQFLEGEEAMRRRWVRAGLWCVTLAACGERTGVGGRPDSTAGAAAATDAAVPSVSWRLEAPSSWDDRVVIVPDPQGAEGLASEGIQSARLFNYVPYDTTVVPQTLLGVYVYDSTAWARLEGEDGPPQGDVVGRGEGIVYVAGFPQSNPFAPGSRDAREFDRRTVTREYVRGAFRAVP